MGGREEEGGRGRRRNKGRIWGIRKEAASVYLSTCLSIHIRLYKYKRKEAWGLGAEGAFCYTINYLFYCSMK